MPSLWVVDKVCRYTNAFFGSAFFCERCKEVGNHYKEDSAYEGPEGSDNPYYKYNACNHYKMVLRQVRVKQMIHVIGHRLAPAPAKTFPEQDVHAEGNCNAQDAA